MKIPKKQFIEIYLCLIEQGFVIQADNLIQMDMIENWGLNFWSLALWLLEQGATKGEGAS